MQQSTTQSSYKLSRTGITKGVVFWLTSLLIIWSIILEDLEVTLVGNVISAITLSLCVTNDLCNHSVYERWLKSLLADYDGII